MSVAGRSVCTGVQNLSPVGGGLSVLVVSVGLCGDDAAQRLIGRQPGASSDGGDRCRGLVGRADAQWRGDRFRRWHPARPGWACKHAGQAPTFPVSYRSVRDWAPYTERGVAGGPHQAGTLLGSRHFSAPLVARLIAATSWRWSFVVTGAIGLVWVGVWLAFPSPHRNAQDGYRRRNVSACYYGTPRRREPPRGAGSIGYSRAAAVTVDVGAGDLAGAARCTSVYPYLGWLPNYLQDRARPVDRELRAVHFGAVLCLVLARQSGLSPNWIGRSDFDAKLRCAADGGASWCVACLLLSSAGLAKFPFVDSLTAVVMA